VLYSMRRLARRAAWCRKLCILGRNARNLSEHCEARWGRGLLLIETFSWPAVERMIERLLARASAATWHEVAAKINLELLWEFDNYTPSKEAVRAV
jgi:hypothetical protein